MILINPNGYTALPRYIYIYIYTPWKQYDINSDIPCNMNDLCICVCFDAHNKHFLYYTWLCVLWFESFTSYTLKKQFITKLVRVTYLFAKSVHMKVVCILNGDSIKSP